MKYLLNFPVYFYNRIKTDNCEGYYYHLVGKKIIYAESAKQAKQIAIAINRHDRIEWDCDIRYNYMDVGLPLPQIVGDDSLSVQGLIAGQQ